MTSFLNRIFNSWRGTTLQAIAAIIIPLTLALVAVSFGSYFLHQNAMRTMVGERDERSVKASAAIIQSEILRREDMLRTLVRFAAEDNFAVRLNSLMDSSTVVFDRGMLLVPVKGPVEVISGSADIWDDINPKDELVAFKTLILNGDAVVVISVEDSATGYRISGAFTPHELLQGALVEDHASHGNSAMYVFDPFYNLLYKNGTGTLESSPAEHPGITEGLAGQSGTTFVQADGDEHVIAYSNIPATGWVIIIEESWEEVATPSLLTTQVTPLILVPALLLAVLMLWFGAEQIVKPLSALEAKAAKVAWGDHQDIEVPVQGIAEIRHLQQELAHMSRQVLAAQQSLHNYIGAITRGQEEERQRLALELHDDTIQSLIALKQRAQLGIRALPKGDPTIPALMELETLTEDTIENLRRTIRALRPIYLEDFGLATALEILTNETAQAFGLQVRYEKKGTERRLEPDVELALYRIAQESLNNVGRHANAKGAKVRIEFGIGQTNLEILDDGIGFTPPSSPSEFMPDGHFGLVGLHERAQLIGAHLRIASAPGQGTKITVSLDK